jgi:hypothetical protein
MTLWCSGKIFRSEPFRWGASLALPPALLGLPAASYAGMAAANILWRLMFERDSPAPVSLSVGLLYGVTFVILLQCVLFGILVIWYGILARAVSNQSYLEPRGS